MTAYTNDRHHLARFDISLEMLAIMLKLPPGAEFVRMFSSNRVAGAISIVVSHPAFKETNWGDWIPEIIATVREENGRWDIIGWQYATGQQIDFKE